jgi:hypothetical protein
MKNINFYLLLLLIPFIYGCSTNKLITKKNAFFEFNELSSNSGTEGYNIVEIMPQKSFWAQIIEKSDNIIIIPKSTENCCITISTTKVDNDDKINSSYIDLIGKKYYPDTRLTVKNASSFNYYDIKFGLQALTIPLKFRRSVGNDTVNPPSVEAGFNVGFAPGWKFTKNIYKQSKNYLGKNTTQIAIALGPHFGIGATDLKKISNAPGLLSDRKRPTFTLGGYFLFGFNNINIGFAIGKDYILGEGRKNWVYQGETWTGIIISLDILKF